MEAILLSSLVLDFIYFLIKSTVRLFLIVYIAGVKISTDFS